MVRRLTLAALIVFAASYAFAQIQVITLLCAFQLIYIGYYKPFVMRWMNWLDIANEWFVIMCTYFLFIYSEAFLNKSDPIIQDVLVKDQEMQEEVGWFHVGTLGALVLLNMIVMMVVSISGLIRKIRLFCLKRKFKKKMAEIERQKTLQTFLKNLTQEADDSNILGPLQGTSQFEPNGLTLQKTSQIPAKPKKVNQSKIVNKNNVAMTDQSKYILNSIPEAVNSAEEIGSEIERSQHSNQRNEQDGLLVESVNADLVQMPHNNTTAEKGDINSLSISEDSQFEAEKAVEKKNVPKQRPRLMPLNLLTPEEIRERSNAIGNFSNVLLAPHLRGGNDSVFRTAPQNSRNEKSSFD